GHPALPMLLRARAEEGSGRSDRARQLIEACLRVEEDLLPAVRDALEYELCAGNWARASELAMAIGSDDIAEPLLRPLASDPTGGPQTRVQYLLGVSAETL